jgi:hypothetical protein
MVFRGLRMRTWRRFKVGFGPRLDMWNDLSDNISIGKRIHTSREKKVLLENRPIIIYYYHSHSKYFPVQTSPVHMLHIVNQRQEFP